MEYTEQSRDALKVTVLTQRISELVANYENQMADFRAQSTIAISQYEAQLEALKNENQVLRDQHGEPETVVGDVVQEVPAD